MADIKQIKLPDGSVLNLKDSAARDSMEVKSNKVTALNSASTDSEYPSAKAVYDLVSSISVPVIDVRDIDGNSLVSSGIATIPSNTFVLDLDTLQSETGGIPLEQLTPVGLRSSAQMYQFFEAYFEGRTCYAKAIFLVHDYDSTQYVAWQASVQQLGSNIFGFYGYGANNMDDPTIYFVGLILNKIGTNWVMYAYVEKNIKPGEIPTNLSELTNDVGYITSYTETDPTVPSWAKASTKPTYTAAEVGALSSNTVYVSTVNGQSGAITIEEPLVIEGTLTFTLSSTSGSGTFTPTSGDVTKIPTANEVYIKADIHGFSMLSSDYVWLRKMRKASTGMGIVMFNGVFDTAGGTVYIEVEGEPDDEGDWHYAIWSVTYRILQQKLTSYVSSVNGASGQVTLTAADVGAVPTSRTINGKALSSNITLTAADVGALSTFTESDPTVPAWAKASVKPTYTYDEVGAPSADQLSIDMGDNQPHKIIKWEHFSYDDPEVSGYYMYVDSTANEWYIPDVEFIEKQSEKLVNQVMVAIPTAVSQLDNDAGYISSAPTAVSQLTNDLNFATTSQVSTAITSAIGEINEFDVEVAAALPTQNIKDHTIYFVAKESSENDIYDEFMYINNAWEHIGSTEVDLSNYVTKTDNAYRAQSIFYGEVDSTSTSTNFTATISGLTELRDGVCILLKNGVVTSASGFTININGLGPKPSYSNMATGNDVTPTAPTRDTTIFNINYTMLFIYSADIVSGGGWIMYRGYDANSNTLGYQLRTNSSVRTATDSVGRYRLLFTSASGSQWVPTTNSTSTNSTAARTVNQRPIDPFGDIVYYGSTTILAPNDSVSATIQWQQYTLNIGYSFNRTGKAQVMTHPAPVYVKCAPQSDGSAIVDADTPYVQALPSSVDGKIYIYLGDAYSATAVELRMNHPVYYYTDGGIRLWSGVNAASKSYVDTAISSIVIPSKVSELTNDVGYISSYTETDPTVPSWAKAASKPTYTASEVGALPSNTTYVSTINGQSGAVTVDTPLVLRGSMSVTLSATHGTGTFTLSSGNPNDIPNHDTVYIVSSSNLSTDDIVLQKNRYSSYYYAYFTTTFRTTLGTVYVEIEGTPDDEYDWDYATWNVRYWVLQDKLTFDSTPTENSTNPVTSGGVYAALQSSGGSDEIYELTATLTATMNILAGGVTFGTFTLVSGDITQVHNYKQAVLKITILKEGDTSVEYGTINAVMTQDFNPARSLTGNCICGLAFVGLCQWYEFLEYMRPRVVTVTYDEQSLTPSLRWHVHDTQMNDDYGNLNYVGWVTGTATAIESGDALLIADSSNHNMLVKSTTTFDGVTTTKALTQAGTFVDFPAAPSAESDAAVISMLESIGLDGNVSLTSAIIGVTNTDNSVIVG